jgi:hypothetical protein
MYTTRIDLGNQTAATVTNLAAGTTYYFAITAYNSSELESVYSDEVAYAPPAETPANQPAALIAQLQLLPDGSVQFNVDPIDTSLAPGGIDVEVSSDLVNWTVLTHLSTPVEAVTLIDPEAVGAAQRFYRLRPL